jgi:hypothetical protein
LSVTDRTFSNHFAVALIFGIFLTIMNDIRKGNLRVM